MTIEHVATGHAVVGTVREADGTPAAGLPVSVTERRLRSEGPLGATTTGGDGAYRVDFATATSNDLIVRVTRSGETVAQATAVADAPEVTVDVTLPGQQKSEYQVTVEAVTPLLDGAGLADLIEDNSNGDFTFLARATGRDALQIGQLAVASRHAAATGLPAEAFYGLLRQGLPPVLSDLARQPTTALQAALASAADADVIQPVADPAAFADRLRALEVAAAVNSPAGATPSPVGELFALALPDPAVRERVYAEFADHTGGPEEFWQRLSAGPADEAQLARLRLTLRLGTLTGNNVPLVSTLLAKFDNGDLTHPRELVTLQWPDLITQNDGVPAPVRSALALVGDNAAATERYADAIGSRVAEAYPSAHVAHRLAADPAHSDAPGTRFLADNPEFDLLATPVNAASVPDEQARHELGAVQRTLKIAPRFEAMQALRDNGFTSAYDVATIGRAQFASSVAGTVDEAEAHAIHARAARVHAAAVNLVSDLRTAGHFDVPWLAAVQPMTAQIPNWDELFGSTDYCACAECRTVYSEAAYLVDLLGFLKRLGQAGQPGPSGDGPISDALYARRSDLWDVQLSCDNTNLSLPYIDLVNEVLEDAVFPNPATAAPLRQSSGDSAHLRVQPQWTNEQPYNVLGGAAYPWNLPFHLWSERTRAYSDLLGVSRDELMTTLHPASAGTVEVATENLRTHALMVSMVTGGTDSQAYTLPAFYGMGSNTPDQTLIDNLSLVGELMNATKLDYADLMATLETRFVNPGSALTIRNIDPSKPCDTMSMQFDNLTTALLDRLHRFTRLRMLLGWSPADLDRVIAACTPGVLNQATLDCVVALRPLRTKLGLPLDRMLALYGPLDTFVYPSESQVPLYDGLFLDNAVVADSDTPNPFALNAGRTELAVIGDLTALAVSAALKGVLALTDTDLAALVTGPRAVVANTSLNLATLSALTRTVFLARALRLPIADLLRLGELRGGLPTPTSAPANVAAAAELASGNVMTPSVVAPLTVSPQPDVAGGGPIQPSAVTPAAAASAPVSTLLADTAKLADEVDGLVGRGFSVAEVDAVLTANLPMAGPVVVPADDSLAATLTALRSAIQAVYQQTAQTTDDKGDLTRKYLSLLGWDADLVQEAVSTLLGTAVYTTNYDGIDATKLPSDIPIRYQVDADGHGTLIFTGPMTADQRDRLQALHLGGESWGNAINGLYTAPRDFVASRMKAFRIPIYSTPLATLPADYLAPADLGGKVFYDVSAGALCSHGYLSTTDIVALAAASSDEAYHNAVHSLADAQEARPDDDNLFLSDDNAYALFDDTVTTPSERFHLVLFELAPRLRRQLSETAVKQQIGLAVGVDAASADLLLGTYLPSQTSTDPANATMVADFLTPDFVGSDPAVVVTRAGFGRQFTALSLLCRAVLVLNRLQVAADALSWLIGYSAQTGWLDLRTLPTTPTSGATPLYGPWTRLLDLVAVRDGLPGGAATLGSALAASHGDGASADGVFTALATGTGWDREDVAVVCASGMLEITVPGELADERGLGKVLAAMRLLRKLGVSAARADSWLPVALYPDIMATIVQAAKARYSPEEWLTAAIPTQDGLREKQRDALVAYLVANPLRDPVTQMQVWSDTNGMYDYFLLDVEMGTAQQTSRIAQAIYSVQLFVQRCLLNLEPTVTPGDTPIWQQWDAMRQYQLWAANQKVFLYPENYFEPDLRLDKSSFFAGLEDELTQNELVAGNIEETFHNYVERLDGVARLQPCGIYHDMHVNGETVHLFACTESTPRTFYHRTWDRKSWTPWEKIDLDIDTPTLVPVVWNNRLHLFWPTFIKTSDPQKVDGLPTTDDPIQAPEAYWQVQLNWSQYTNGKWQAKRVTKDTINTWKWGRQDFPPADDVEIAKYSFQPSIDPVSRELTIWMVYYLYIHLDGQSDWVYLSGRFVFSPRTGAATAEPMVSLTDSDPRSVGRAKPPFNLTDTIPQGNQYMESPWNQGTTARVFLPNATGFGSDQLVLAQRQGTDKFRLQLPMVRQNPPGWFRDSATFTDAARSYFMVPMAPPSAAAALEPPADAGGATALARVAGSGSVLGATTVPLDNPMPQYQFVQMYHPHVDIFVTLLNRLGLDALFGRAVQTDPGGTAAQVDPSGNPTFDFNRYQPQAAVATPYPSEQEVDFTDGAPYAQYNWELFFHAPLLLAERLSTNLQFADAQRWFHRIFDPTARGGGDGPGRYWITKPFYQRTDYQTERIENILLRLAQGFWDATYAVDQWLAEPFQPDVVAKLRTTAYQKAVVMKYLDNLIAWGDNLFRQDTLEAVNQATQLYILASELLGPRPTEVPEHTPPAAQSYRYIQGLPASVVTAAESLIPRAADTVTPAIAPTPGVYWYAYFKIPRNEKLLGYWDTVADRLFKIRNSQTIDGQQRQFTQFGAPIDPALLARAAAAGVDLSTVLDDIGAPVPHYRFTTMLAKAKEFAGEVKSFGAELLAALEKRDAEALARLRSGHELAVLTAARDVRLAQITEEAHSIDALTQSRAAAQEKTDYYATREYMNANEQTHAAMTRSAITVQTIAAAIDMTVSVMRLLPELKIGSPMTIGATWGGTNLGESLKGLSGSLGQISNTLSAGGALAATHGGYNRRQDDWVFQAGQGSRETAQYDAQLAAAAVRREIAVTELANHDKQIANAREEDAFLHQKYTGQELYDWMAGQLSTTYFQAYQLAYDVAKRAERAYRHELGLADSNFISFGYWDSLHKGLLAGDRLATDLNRMDAAYLEGNAREFELTKRISLAQLDPTALLSLKETGRCFLSLPEAVFDLDTPGHYMRRIRSLSVTVPCVAGPYTGVNLTATLLGSSVRVDPRLPADTGYPRGDADNRFRDYSGPIESIVTSTGQDDSGLFETNLRDERYLPFEGAGAVSEWQLSLPTRLRQFDYESITDVVLTVRYTARDGGQSMAAAATDHLEKALADWVRAGGGNGLVRSFSLRREFPDQWNKLVGGSQDVTFALSKTRFPYAFRDDRITLGAPQLVFVLSTDLIPDGSKSYVDCYSAGANVAAKLTDPRNNAVSATLVADPALGGQPHGGFTGAGGQLSEAGENWVATIPVTGLETHLKSGNAINPDAVVDVLLLWPYTIAKVTA